MGSADWSDFNNQLSSASVIHKSTLALYTAAAVPEGDFVHGFRSLVANAPGFSGMYCNKANFGPMAKGGVLRASMRKHTSHPNLSPMLFFVNSNNIANAPQGYMLGLSRGAVPALQLSKGALTSGLNPASGQYLRQSAAPASVGTWYDLQLELVWNPQGDLVINVKKNTGTLAVPIWSDVVGLERYIDDNLGALSTTLPIAPPFYAGFGVVVGDGTVGVTGASAFFDYVKLSRQLNP